MDVPARTSGAAPRKDVARNRSRILAAAREVMRPGRPLQLNAVAQAADVGVGTVYRHFPTPDALIEALAEDQFAALVELAHQQADAAEPVEALRNFLRAGLTAYVSDAAFAAAAVDPEPATARLHELRGQLLAQTDALASRAIAVTGHDNGLQAADLMVLLCGIGYAVRNSPRPPTPALADLYLSALLDGALSTRPTDG
jgi:AcrR family transcriptional regulator